MVLSGPDLSWQHVDHVDLAPVVDLLNLSLRNSPSIHHRIALRKASNHGADVLLAHIGGVGPLGHGVDDVGLTDLEQLLPKNMQNS